MLGQSPFAPLDTATSTTISLCLCSYQTNETCTLETPSHTGTSFTTRDIPNHRLLDQCATWRPPVQWFSSQEPQRAWSLHPPAVSGVDSPSTSDNVARQFKPQSGDAGHAHGGSPPHFPTQVATPAPSLLTTASNTHKTPTHRPSVVCVAR